MFFVRLTDYLFSGRIEMSAKKPPEKPAALRFGSDADEPAADIALHRDAARLGGRAFEKFVHVLGAAGLLQRFGHRFCIREAEAAEIDHDVRAHGCDFFGEIRRFLAVQNGIFFLLPRRVLRVGAAFSVCRG